MLTFEDFFKLNTENVDIHTKKKLILDIITGENATSGSYDIGAINPGIRLRPRFIFHPNKLKRIFEEYKIDIGNVLFFIVRDSGSYHSQTLEIKSSIEIYVPQYGESGYLCKRDLNQNLRESFIFHSKMSDVNHYLHDNINDTVYYETPFTSFRKTLEDFKQFALNDPTHLAKTGESSENYWKRKVLQATMRHKRTYDGD